MSQALTDLVLEVRTKAEEFLEKCKKIGLKVMVTQTLRTPDEQQMLFDQGRTKPGMIVTRAKPGYSWHNFGKAFDVCFINGEGKPTWIGDWEVIGAIGKSCGLEWGGDWIGFPDRPHFQYTAGMTLAEARAGDPWFAFKV